MHTDSQSTASSAADSNQWIGKRTIRPDGEDKVTGRAAFGADFAQPGMLWGKVLRSPHPHARIASINVDLAAAAPGVKAVITGADLVDFRLDTPVMVGPADMRFVSRNVMARDKALYAGHAVAAVAATSAAAAEAALALIDVDYELLPWVIDVDEAMQSSAPILHDHLRTAGDESAPDEPNQRRKPHAVHARRPRGWIRASGHHRRTPLQDASPCTRATSSRTPAWSSVPADGQATIWSSSQGQFMVRNVTAKMTGARLSDIRAIPAEIGGGFGGKTIIYLEPLAYTLSKQGGRAGEDGDDARRSVSRHGTDRRIVEYGQDRRAPRRPDRRRPGDVPLPGRRFPKLARTRPSATAPSAPYAIDNVKVVGYDIVANRPKCNAYRAPGSPIAAFGVESVIDELAARTRHRPHRVSVA